MIIVSQARTELINFNNIVRLSVDVNANGEFLIEAHNFCDDFETVIGLYKTKERAQEVLQEIIEQYEYCQVLQEGHGISLSSGNNYVYTMPKE